MFCTITSLVVLSTETSIDFYDLQMTSSSSSGDFSTSFSSTRGTSSVWRNPCSLQPAVTLSQLELICHHFQQLGNTSFSYLTTRTGFWILGFFLLHCSNNQITTMPAVGTALSFMGPRSHPWLFFFLHVHLARVSSNLRLTPWMFHRRFWRIFRPPTG